MEFSSRLSSIYLLLALSMSSAFCPLNADACSLNSYILMFENLNQRYRIIINKIKMFNPQRKSKVSDIFMQQKIYKLHLAKMNQIENSLSLRSKRYDQEEEQQRYLTRIEKSKREVKDRLSSDIKRENQRLLAKLIETDIRPEANPEQKGNRKHFNSYFSMKKETDRIHQQNYTLVMRMDQKSPGIPSLKQLKKQYKQSRKFAKNCRKLPSIVKHEEQFKKKISMPLIDSPSQSNTISSRANL